MDDSGICEIASGYMRNARPGPPTAALAISPPLSRTATKPIVAKTVKPAKMLVKQSHTTTMTH